MADRKSRLLLLNVNVHVMDLGLAFIFLFFWIGIYNSEQVEVSGDRPSPWLFSPSE